MPRHTALASLTSLAFALLLPAAPAQASEVVKLARLVITGKRLSAEPQREPAPLATTKQDEAPQTGAAPKAGHEQQSSVQEQPATMRAAALQGRTLMRGAL